MNTASEPATDFVRLALFVKKPRDYTPGDIAQLTGLDPELIGLITIEDEHILVDVHKAHKKEARSRLVEIGGCKLLFDRELQWVWMRLNIGRNHGLTMRRLRMILEDADARPVGRIHINNNFTVIGLREDRFETTAKHLASRSINGITLQPRTATQGETRGEDPRFFHREEKGQPKRC